VACGRRNGWLTVLRILPSAFPELVGEQRPSNVPFGVFAGYLLQSLNRFKLLRMERRLLLRGINGLDNHPLQYKFSHLFSMVRFRGPA
jgi:hypothetical protein